MGVFMQKTLAHHASGLWLDGINGQGMRTNITLFHSDHSDVRNSPYRFGDPTDDFDGPESDDQSRRQA